jgi:hypothetical protein
MEQKITNENIKIEDIKKFDVFVFGSNLRGIHGAGAAAFVYKNGLSTWGHGTGIYLRQRERIGSYAIPTKGMNIEVLPLDWIKYFVDRFIEDVDNDTDGLNFIVTKIGCGLAGFTVPQIAPLFQELAGMENVSLPQDFIDFYAGTYKEPEDKNKKQDDKDRASLIGHSL